MQTVTTFNFWIAAARAALEGRSFDGTVLMLPRDRLLSLASGHVAQALGCANGLADAQRRALCLRLLTWMRADMARTARLAA